MKEHKDDEVCVRCGYKFWQHRLVNGACPTKAGKKWINGTIPPFGAQLFSLIYRFKAKA